MLADVLSTLNNIPRQVPG